LSVPVAAGTVFGQQVQVQFGIGDIAAPVPVQTVTLDLDPRAGQHTWQEVPVPLGTGLRATAVRMLVRDAITGPDSWVAVAEPTLSSWQSVPAITAGQPVFADPLSAALWPCVDQVAIRHGIVEPPTVQLLADDGVPPGVLLNQVNPLWGGSLITASRTATYVMVPSRIHPSGPTMREWGRVQRVVYDYPFGLVDLRVVTSTQPGWHREPTITGEAYSGRKYQG
jgi:arabinosyltransferase B/arabinosyltransferase C